MAKTTKEKASKEATKKRKRRSDEELIRDLQARLQEVKERQNSKQVLRSPAMKSAVKALNAIDRALDVAADQNETPLRHALADARRPLVAELERNGFKTPKAVLPRGRRPKVT